VIFKSTYPRIREGNLILIPNDPKSGTHHQSSELETASEILLDQNYLARDLLNLIRARTFDGFPACWFTEDNVKYEVRINIKKVEL
jgi:methionyl-tRNA formyltransferase